MKFFSTILVAIAFSISLHAQPQPPAPPSTPDMPLPLAQATLDKISAMTPLFDGKTLNGWVALPKDSWTVKEGAMSSLGTGRGVIYTKSDYGNYRLIFNMRHLSGQPDHQACFLIFCERPADGEKGRDALGGIQFQPPNGGHWDYRPGHNNAGKGEFNSLTHPKFNPHDWSQVEILVNAKSGTGRMAVAQPIGSRAVEVLEFKEPTAGRTGPIAWQMHNKGLFDEYKDVRIEVDPKDDKLITVE